MSRIRYVVLIVVAIFGASVRGADADTMILAPGQGGQAENRVLDEMIKRGDRMALLARDLGGLAQLTKFLTQPDKDAVARTLTSYGIKFVNLNERNLANDVQSPEGAVSSQASR